MALVLLYNFTEETRRRKVKAALFRCALPCREVSPEEQHLPLEALLNGEGASAEAETEAEMPFPEEMIVMQGLNPRQFQDFLEGLKGRKIIVPLKAVVTEHNLRWTSVRLRNELMAEHQAMSVRGGKPLHG